jgi:ABC-type multidrug transport system fused ATPase/permease subunit
MKAYQHIWRMIRFRPVLYTASAIVWALIHLAPIIPGLIAQQFFNALPQVRGLNGTLWMLIALLVVTALARSLMIVIGGWADSCLDLDQIVHLAPVYAFTYVGLPNNGLDGRMHYGHPMHLSIRRDVHA